MAEMPWWPFGEGCRQAVGPSQAAMMDGPWRKGLQMQSQDFGQTDYGQAPYSPTVTRTAPYGNRPDAPAPIETASATTSPDNANSGSKPVFIALAGLALLIVMAIACGNVISVVLGTMFEGSHDTVMWYDHDDLDEEPFEGEGYRTSVDGADFPLQLFTNQDAFDA